jgi:RpiB/LacA/LacB family sugar-phosphate isomerase
MTMNVAVASDHAGFSLKGKVLEYLSGLGHTVEDLGTCNTTPVDYPDFAEAVANAILSERAERAVLICGSGVGASVAANKFRGIRAGLCHDTYSAHQGVEHDHMNVLVLGGRVIGEALARELVGAFVNAKQSQEERHLRRLAKIEAIEEKCGLESLRRLVASSD